MVTFTQNLSGANTMPLIAVEEGSCPGIVSNLKLTIIVAKNTNNESSATTSPKQTLGPRKMLN